MTATCPVRISVISSVRVSNRDSEYGPEGRRRSPNRAALEFLSRAGIAYADLYCFSEGDLPASLLEAGAPTPGSQAERIAAMDVSRFIEKWTSGAHRTDPSGAYLSGRRIAALATNLPNISSPDENRRREAVRALSKLLSLAHGLSVPVIEVVGGPNFCLVEGSAGPVSARVGGQTYRERLDSLIESLSEINALALPLNPPVVLALELEPGISYLLNGFDVVSEVFRRLDRRVPNKAKRRIFLNLDIGHAALLKQRDRGLWNKLSEAEWRSRIVHAHIGHHVSTGHGADLPLKPVHRSRYQKWIDLVVESWCKAPVNRFASRTIALELEASATREDIVSSLGCLSRWMGDSIRRWIPGAPDPQPLSVPPPPETKGAVKIFLCYAHKDTKWCQEIRNALQAQFPGGEVTCSSDEDLQAGDRWEQGLITQIAEATASVVLVSRRWLTSEFIQKVEWPKIKAAADAGRQLVLWVPVSACEYKKHEVEGFQALIDPAKPLENWAQKGELEDALLGIARKVEEALNQRAAETSGGPAPG